MSLRDALIQKVENQINAWEKEVEAAKADAKEKESQAENAKADAALKEEVMGNIRGIQQRIDQARQKLDELQQAGEDQLDQLKTQISAWLS